MGTVLALMYRCCRNRKAAMRQAFSSHHSLVAAGLHGSGGNVELLDVLRADVNDLIDVLESAFDQEEFGIGDKIPVGFVEVGVDDGVSDAGLVLD